MSNYERDKKSIMRYQKENIVYVHIALKKAEKERWKAYADSLNIPLSTLLKNLMKEEMEK